MEKIDLISLIEQFLKDWQDQEDTLAVLLCGSQATGCEDDYSDIDLQLVMKTGPRRKGTRII